MVSSWKINSFILAVILCITIVGCATPFNVQLSSNPRSDAVEYRDEVLDFQVQDYANTFDTIVSQQADFIRDQSNDPEIRANAIQWKLNSIRMMRMICFNKNRAGAACDAWVFSMQMEQFFTEGAGSEIFGEHQAIAIHTSKRLVERIETVFESMIEETPEEIRLIYVNQWIDEHPIKDISFSRVSFLGGFADQMPENSSSVFTRISRAEEQFTLFADEINQYLEALPRYIRWEAELARERITSSDEVQSLIQSIEQTGQAAEGVSALVQSVPILVQNERRLVLDEIGVQRELLLESFASELDAISSLATEERQVILVDVDAKIAVLLDQFASERELIITAITEQIKTMIEAIQQERSIVLQRSEQIAGSTIDQTTEDLKLIFDELFLKLILLILALIIAAPFIAHIYARVWPTVNRN